MVLKELSGHERSKLTNGLEKSQFTLCFTVYTVNYTVLYSCKAHFTLCITLCLTEQKKTRRKYNKTTFKVSWGEINVNLPVFLIELDSLQCATFKIPILYDIFEINSDILVLYKCKS